MANLNIRLTEEDEKVVGELRQMYDGVDMTTLVRRLLRRTLQDRPSLTIEPKQGKSTAPAAAVSSSLQLN